MSKECYLSSRSLFTLLEDISLTSKIYLPSLIISPFPNFSGFHLSPWYLFGDFMTLQVYPLSFCMKYFPFMYAIDTIAQYENKFKYLIWKWTSHFAFLLTWKILIFIDNFKITEIIIWNNAIVSHFIEESRLE